MRSERWCPGSGGAPSYLDKDAVWKTADKHYGKPIYSLKCVVCGQRFNTTSKIKVPEHDRILPSLPPEEPEEETPVEGARPDDPAA